MATRQPRTVRTRSMPIRTRTARSSGDDSVGTPFPDSNDPHRRPSVRIGTRPSLFRTTAVRTVRRPFFDDAVSARTAEMMVFEERRTDTVGETDTRPRRTFRNRPNRSSRRVEGRESKSRQTGESANQQIDEAENQQIGEAAKRQVGETANRRNGEAGNSKFAERFPHRNNGNRGVAVSVVAFGSSFSKPSFGSKNSTQNL